MIDEQWIESLIYLFAIIGLTLTIGGISMVGAIMVKNWRDARRKK